MVELTIADTGSGLTDEMRERLFLPYFSTKQRGTGLGLAIAAKIIQEHQGTIRAEKNEPAGAKFIVELRPASSLDSDPTLVRRSPVRRSAEMANHRRRNRSRQRSDNTAHYSRAESQPPPSSEDLNESRPHRRR